MVIHESAENYLEAVLMLCEKNGSARSVEVAEFLNVSKPSVSVAMKNLRENGYIEMQYNGNLTLTEKGFEIARRMYERHTLIKEFLCKIGVSEENASEDACRIEHAISEETFDKLKAHIETI